jgi:Rrf2 family protein
MIVEERYPMAKASSTMQVTRAADYGIRVMIHMATLPAHERALLPALARATGAPQSFLSKVLQALCRAGFIVSRRGQAGGFEMLPPGRKATVHSVIEAVEGPISLNLCLISGSTCKRKSFCPAHPVWASAQDAMLGVLNAATIADMALKQAAAQPRAPRAKSKPA